MSGTAAETVERIDVGAGYWIEINGEWATLTGPSGIVFLAKSEDDHPRVREFAAAMFARIAELKAANAVCRRDIEALMSSCDTLEAERDRIRAECASVVEAYIDRDTLDTMRDLLTHIAAVIRARPAP